MCCKSRTKDKTSRFERKRLLKPLCTHGRRILCVCFYFFVDPKGIVFDDVVDGTLKSGARLPSTRPDVAVLDVQLGEGSGVEVCRDIRSMMPEVGCLMLTSFSDDEAVVESVLAGAQGYVLKQVVGSDLIESIRAVARNPSRSCASGCGH